MEAIFSIYGHTIRICIENQSINIFERHQKLFPFQMAQIANYAGNQRSNLPTSAEHQTLNIQKIADAAKKTASPIAKGVFLGYRKAELLLKCSFVSSESNHLSSMPAESFILGVSLVDLFFFHGEDQVSDLLVYSSSRKSGR